jgi:PAS domain S-box-containing protein
MVLRKDLTARITDLLRQNPQGLSITEIVQKIDINRNTAGRYLDNLLISGQVEMRHFGMAKIYSFSRRLPVSSVLSLSSEYVMQIDTGLRVVFLNRPFAVLIGTEEREFTGKNIEFTKIPSFFDDVYPPVLNAIRKGLEGRELRGEMDIHTCDRTFSYRVVPIVFTSGQKGVSLIFEDVTEWKRNEERLRDSEEKFRTLFNNADDIIMLHQIGGDLQHGNYIEVNDMACRKLKYTRQELLSMTPRDLVAGDSILSISSSTFRKLRTDGNAMFEAVLLTKDHQRLPVEINLHRFNFKGKPVALAIIRDITGRIAEEEERRQNEENRRFIAEHCVDIIHRMTPELVLLYSSPSITTLLGYGERELLGKSVADMIYPEDMPRVMAELDAAGKSDRDRITLTFRFRHKDGHYVLLETATRIIRDSAGNARELLNITRDISTRTSADCP